MAQSDEKKVQINIVQLIIIVVLLAFGFVMGSKVNTLSKKDEKYVKEITLLKASKDSLLSTNKILSKEVERLKASVTTANQNTINSEAVISNYKKKYKELKESIASQEIVECDSSIRLECEKQLIRYEDYSTILKANILSYKNYSDTLTLRVTTLEKTLSLSEQFAKRQETQLNVVAKKARRRGSLNWILGGIAAALTIVVATK